jgi:putative transposase
MVRPPRAAQGGLVYHTLDRANARLTIFEDDGDFAAFEEILDDAVTRYAMRLVPIA